MKLASDQSYIRPIKENTIDKIEIRPIPLTAGFLADECGNIYDKNGLVRNTYRNLDGYITASVKFLDGFWRTVGVHRLVCLAFYENPDCAKYTTVNHIDGNVENNTSRNVEWATQKENNIHSELMRADNTRDVLAVTLGESTMWFKSLLACSEAIGVSYKEIWKAIKNEVLLDGYSFKYLPWVAPVQAHLRKRRGMLPGHGGTKESEPIKMLNVITGELLVFPSLRAASDNFSVTPTHIWRSVSGRHGCRISLFQKKYLVEYVKNEFPEYTREEILEAIGRGPKDVLARNLKTDQCVIYASAKEFYVVNKLSKKAVTVPLAKDKIKQVGDWIFLYMSDENAKRISTYVDVQVKNKCIG